jgi:hypothetical protein
MVSENIVWNLTMYVVAMTDEAPTVYTPEAYLPWEFNGSAKIDGNTWNGNGAGIFYGHFGATQPIGNALWSATQGAAPAGYPAFTTSVPRFNTLIQPDAESKKLPVVFL